MLSGEKSHLKVVQDEEKYISNSFTDIGSLEITFLECLAVAGPVLTY